MKRMRSGLLGLMLTIFVSLCLASTGLAHRIPSAVEQATQALQLAGVPVADICGQTQDGKSGGAHPCPACLAGIAMLAPPVVRFAPVAMARDVRVDLPRGILARPQQLLLCPDSQAPPALI